MIVLRNAFKAFDLEGTGFIDHSDVSAILEILGQKLEPPAVKALIKEVDKGTTGKLNFSQFCKLAARFIEVEEDVGALQAELKEAFRVYDKEGKGYLTVATLRGILHELDDKISSQDLDLIIEEIDADGSGTVDFDGEQTEMKRNYIQLKIKFHFIQRLITEFMQVMTGK